MSYSDVEWSNGDTPATAKGNQMQDNLDYVREIQRARTVAQHAGEIELGGFGTSNWSLRVNVGELEFTSSSITATAYGNVAGLVNLDVSSLVAGVPYTLAITGVRLGGELESMGSTTFFATSDLDFLNIFGQVRRGGTEIAALRGYTAIVTRNNEGF